MVVLTNPHSRILSTKNRIKMILHLFAVFYPPAYVIEKSTHTLTLFFGKSNIANGLSLLTGRVTILFMNCFKNPKHNGFETSLKVS